MKQKEVENMTKEKIEEDKIFLDRRSEAEQEERVLYFTKQISEISSEEIELETQKQFLSSYYSEQNEHDLSVYMSMQKINNQKAEKELNRVLQKFDETLDELNGPTIQKQKKFYKNKRKIQEHQNRLKNLKIEEKSLEFECEQLQFPMVLPEELELKRNNLLHQLQILKHRRGNIEREMAKKRDAFQTQKIEATLTKSGRRAAEDRERRERQKFRQMMKKRHQKQREQAEEMLRSQRNTKSDNNEENWNLITFVSEAKEEISSSDSDDNTNEQNSDENTKNQSESENGNKKHEEAQHKSKNENHHDNENESDKSELDKSESDKNELDKSEFDKNDLDKSESDRSELDKGEGESEKSFNEDGKHEIECKRLGDALLGSSASDKKDITVEDDLDEENDKRDKLDDDFDSDFNSDFESD